MLTAGMFMAKLKQNFPPQFFSNKNLITLDEKFNYSR